jgi:hypothetical protein
MILFDGYFRILILSSAKAARSLEIFCFFRQDDYLPASLHRQGLP